MTSEKEIKDCPFCGEKPRIGKSELKGLVACCNTTWITRAEWNTRHPAKQGLDEKEVRELIGRIAADWKIEQSDVGRELLVIPMGTKAFDLITKELIAKFGRSEVSEDTPNQLESLRQSSMQHANPDKFILNMVKRQQ